VRVIAITFAILASIVCAFVVWRELTTSDTDFLQLGSLVILTLTLIVLVWYAYDTNTIATVTRERWVREGVLATTYNMVLPGASVGDSGRTIFQLSNASPLIVRARVNFNFEVYGSPVSAGPLYDGSEKWVLFPHQLSQGWFEVAEVATLLKLVGRDVPSVQAQTSDENYRQQLTMVLELEFCDEFGVSRTLPPRPHYFDFKRWTWVPRLGEHSSIRPPA
jgi:hypothetical protein